ncbi:hypothetical protein Gocc_2706 [Gaiella occulta]|uniref:Thioredoxin n=1 Tax=Gaiella occulta TaxID=1002870 RepID=A0A7M2YU64_9ACTN|nr:hypothetical protein [Gaiella occulta]RDI73565.1 hypothetical protein Gocc_2706 [Gaiella occulta]
MTFHLTPQARILAIVGLAGLLAVSALMASRAGVIGAGSAGSSPTATRVVTTIRPALPATTRPATEPTTPKVVLLPGLPQPVARALRTSKVVVVSLYAGPAQADRAAVAQARAGARTAGAGFVAMNVVDDRKARQLASFVGPVSPPTLLVVRRPGRVLTRIEGTVDSTIVAQAAHDAGARRR